jgi:hypothetical protein
VQLGERQFTDGTTRPIYRSDDGLQYALDHGQGVIQAPAGYAPACGQVARVQIGKAGKRLADTFSELIKQLEPSNW